MSFTEHLLRGISDEERRSGEKQVFISHEFRSRDLRVKLERALKQLGLEAYFADKEVTGQFILNKICKKILITRASIVDLSTSNPNVYFELGVAIGLNKPIFIVLRDGAPVPTLLENFVKLRFTSYAALEQSLISHAPKWLTESIEHHLLYNTHCHFVSVPCPDRLPPTPWLNRQRSYLLIDQIEQRDSDNQIRFAGDPDLSAELRAALDMFQYLPILLDDVPLTDAFRFCDYCRSLRRSSFVLCHLDRRSSANVYLLLGLVTGLGLPTQLLIHRELDAQGRLLFDIPSMLNGIDSFRYESYSDIGERLGEAVEGFIEEQKDKRGRSQALVFRERPRPEKHEEREAERTRLTEDEVNIILQEMVDLIPVAGQDEESVARMVLLAVRALLGQPDITASLTLLLPNQDVWAGDVYTVDVQGQVTKTSDFKADRGLSGLAMISQSNLLVDDVRMPQWNTIYYSRSESVVSELDVPILSNSRVLGVLTASSPKESAFNPRDTVVLERLGMQVAPVLENLRHGLSGASTPAEDDAILVEDDSMPTPSDVPAFEYDVFISYSSEDADWVLGELLPRLEGAGFRVCIDFKSFQVDSPFLVEIEKAIVKSRHTLSVLTPNYMQSQWGEFTTLLVQTIDPVNRQRRLVPLLKEPCQLPMRLQALTSADFTNPNNQNWGHLIASLGSPSNALLLDRAASGVIPDVGTLPQLSLVANGSRRTRMSTCTQFTFIDVEYMDSQHERGGRPGGIVFTAHGARSRSQGFIHKCEWELTSPQLPPVVEFADYDSPSSFFSGAIMIPGLIDASDPAVEKIVLVRRSGEIPIGSNIPLICTFRHRISNSHNWCIHTTNLLLTAA